MKCVYKETAFVGNHFSKSELWTETREGRIAPLLPIREGVRAKLTVTDKGFTLSNVEGEVLRCGNEKDVFSIYDGAMYPVEPLRVETRDFEGTFTEYERTFGHGRVSREEKRRFKAYYVRTKDGIGLGLIEYRRLKTTAIYSLFLPEPMSDKEVINYIAEFATSKLKACEMATITGTQTEPSQLHGKHAGVIKMYSNPYGSTLEQVHLLALDALKRETSISERFAEPLTYKPQGIFNEEGEL